MARHRRTKRRGINTLSMQFSPMPLLDFLVPPLSRPIATTVVALGLLGFPSLGLAQNMGTIAAPSVPAPEPATLLEADTIEQGDTEGVIIATGNVTSRAQGRTLRADKVIYNQRTGLVNAIGNVVVLNADGSTQFADQLTLDDELATGVAENFSARLSDGAVLAATAAVRRERVGNLMSNVIYTACQLCKDGKTKPTWVMRARRANQDQVNETINYNDVVFEVKGVPVLYLPYFQHGDPSVGRRSGFLQPTPGRSSRFGWFWEQPYLQIIDASSDIIVKPLISQYVNPLLQAQYRRRFFSGDMLLSGSVTREKFFAARGKKFGDLEWRSHLFARARFNLNETWNWGFGAETASDDLYLFRYRIASDGQPRGLIRPQTSRLISEVFVQGQGERFYARSLAASFQDLIGAPGDPNSRRKNVPRVAPLVEVNYHLNWGPMRGRLDITGSGVALQRSQGRLDSLRASLGAHWRGSTILPGGIVIEPSAYARTDYFDYSAQTRSNIKGFTPVQADSFARTVGLVSLQASYPLVRPGARLTLTLEPKINATLASDATEQDRVRIEDGVGFEMDSTSLFRSTSAPGNDQWDGGSRVSVGVSAGLDLPNDATRATLFLGRRFNNKRDATFSRASNLDRQSSDWVSEFDLNYRNVVSIGGRARFDGESGALVHSEATARLKLWRTETDVRYHDFASKTAGPGRTNSEVQATTRFTLTKNLKAFASVNRNLTDKATLYEAYGIIYGDDCTDFRFFVERLGTRSRFLEPSNSIRFQIAFRTLGVLSDAPFD